MTSEPRRILDLHGAEDTCGDSVLYRFRRALDGLSIDEHLEVLTDVADHAFVIQALAIKAGRAVDTLPAEPREHRLLIR